MAGQLQLQKQTYREDIIPKRQNISQAIQNYFQFVESIPVDEMKACYLEDDCANLLGCLAAGQKLASIYAEIPSSIKSTFQDSCLAICDVIQRIYRKIKKRLQNYRCQNTTETQIMGMMNGVADDPNYNQFSSNNISSTHVTSTGKSSGSSSASHNPSTPVKSWVWDLIRYGLGILGAMAAGGVLGAATTSCTGLGIVAGIVAGAATGAATGGAIAAAHYYTTKNDS